MKACTDDLTLSAATLRQRAEALAGHPTAPLPAGRDALSAVAIQRMLHDLRVHQIELEMQGEELRRSQAELSESRSRYFELYDLAPVGYLTVNENGLILEANLTAAALLGRDRSAMVRQRLSRFIFRADQDSYYQLRKQLLLTGEAQILELRMLKQDGSSFWAQLQVNLTRSSAKKFVWRLVVSDVTERRQAEEQRQEALDRLQKIAGRVPGMVYQFRRGPDGALTMPYASEGIREIYRLSPEAVRDDVGAAMACHHPDDVAAIVASIEQSARELTPWQHEYRVQFADGTLRWLQGNALPEREADGSTLWHGFVTDITARKQAKELLLASQADFQAIANYAASWEGWFSPAGKLLWMNSYSIELTGYTPDEYLAADDVVAMVVAEPDCARVRGFFKQAMLGSGGENLEARCRRKDGSQFWATINWRPILDAKGRSLGFRTSTRNISGRKLAETALQESEQRYALLAAQSLTVAWEVDPQGLYTYVSPVAASVLGYRPEDLIGKRHFYDLHPPQGREDFAANALAMMARRERFRDLVNPAITKDGHKIWLSTNGVPVVDAGTLTAYRGSDTDITAREQAEIFRGMGLDILLILNQPEALPTLLPQVVAILKKRSGCDAAALRLQAGEDFPYCAQEGFPAEFLATENSLLERNAEGLVCRDCSGKACLECTCGLVIDGKTLPSNPLFTRGGSFWTNDSFQLLDLPPALDPRNRPRNICLQHGYASIALVPIRNKEKIVGLIQLNDRRHGFFSLPTLELLEGIAMHIGEAMMRKQTEDALHQSKAALHGLTARLQAVREEERASLSRELHDFFGQHLTALQIDLMWMDRHLQSKNPLNLALLYDRIVAMEPIVERLTEQTQTICASLRPSVLYDLGLVAAIEWQLEDTAKRTGLRWSLSQPDEELHLEESCALTLFRIVQEALINVIRHARATQVEVRLSTVGCELELLVQDNGRGFASKSQPGAQALGLLGMRERVAALGGTLELLNPAPTGAAIRVRVEMPAGAANRKPAASV